MLEVCESMFEADAGMVFLADRITNGDSPKRLRHNLALTSGQTRHSQGGRAARLAVVEGVVNEAVVRLIVSALPDRQRVVVCGTGIDVEARMILRELRPGSTLRKSRRHCSTSTGRPGSSSLRMRVAEDAAGAASLLGGRRQP